MRIVTSNVTLNCAWLDQPELILPKITDGTKGKVPLQFQEKQKLRWTDYHFQMAINAVAVETITVTVDEQYIDKLREEYVGYTNVTIKP